MIELRDDELCFSFPAIEAEISALRKDYYDKKLPKMLAEDREKVIDQLVKRLRRSQETVPDRDKVRDEVLKVTEEQIAGMLQNALAPQWEKNTAKMEVAFKRTLRIPDNDKTYPLPPGLGSFPLRHLEDYAEAAPPQWLERGGVIMPMYQAEALWMSFYRGTYPCALKIAAGKINAVSGESWQAGLSRKPQDYVVTGKQPWLDGFAVEKGVIRQFVAMPLGAGYSVEEQLSGEAEFGGVQLQAYPMKARAYFDKVQMPDLPKCLADLLQDLIESDFSSICFSGGLACAGAGMGLGAGGRMRQKIYKDPYKAEDWDMGASSRCFVHLCNAMLWRELTGENPPQPPVTAREYEKAGLPWFDYYAADLKALNGSKKLAGVQSVGAISKSKGDQAIPANESVKVPRVVKCGPSDRVVKEWAGE
ncbi:hypothetical protein [Prosthecobacter sp.]|uniref:hypothetical protein n=1 Tax=Prosthecobacter sp. TaxID=1965333 RepID=UPI003782DD56